MLKFIKQLLSNTESNALEMPDFEHSFVSLSCNMHQELSHGRVIQLESHHSSSDQFVAHYINNHLIIEKRSDNNLIDQTKNSDQMQNDFINIMANCFSVAIENSKKFVNEPSDVTSQFASENKGLEWIKTTLTVLKQAIHEARENEDLMFTGQLFFGRRQVNEPYQVRIQCLSLDFLLLFLDDGRLNLTVWNYKNGTPDPTMDPVFTGEFVQLKQHVFDEIIPILVEMSRSFTKMDL